MDELMWLRLFGGGFGSGVDLAAVLAFVVFGVVSFLAPVVGYRPGRSGGVTASLYLLVGYVGVSVIQLIVQWAQLLDGKGNPPLGRGQSGMHILLAFALLKLLLFLAAILAFAIGVGSFRLSTFMGDDEPDVSPGRGRM
jgi:hypothetical protein